MFKIYEDVREELKHETNRCRMELVCMQDQYYTLIIKNLFVTYLNDNENIALYSKQELLDMLEYLGNTVEEVGIESRIDGTQTYDINESWPYIKECIQRVMQKYGFKDWDMK